MKQAIAMQVEALKDMTVAELTDYLIQIQGKH